MTCGHDDRPHYARGLCRPCYQRARLNGSLEQFARKTRNPHEVAEEVEHASVTFATSDRLGYKPLGLYHALLAAGRRDLVQQLGGKGAARRANKAYTDS